jgi:hypothetical protein
MVLLFTTECATFGVASLNFSKIFYESKMYIYLERKFLYSRLYVIVQTRKAWDKAGQHEFLFIREHPFGSIKRHWGFTHTLLKGLQKVNGEMNLIMFCYDFMRTKNILGFDKMLQAIQNWTPDYKRVVCAFKKAFIKIIYVQNAQPYFLKVPALCF